jgi:hypothetical protein
MSKADALRTLRDYVERSTHWQEGGATRHDAMLALKELEGTPAMSGTPPVRPVVWTKPHYGIQHTPRNSRGEYCTVQDNRLWAEVHCYFEGCGFNPICSHHTDAAAARAAGEQWLAGRPE